MSQIGGLLAVPMFLIMHLMSGDTMTSFMGIVDTVREKEFNFYFDMFSSKWQNVVIMMILPILYTLKPITTTNFVLSCPSVITFVSMELFAKIFFIFITMIFIESNAMIAAMEALGLSFALLS